jgi:hypothetical protein
VHFVDFFFHITQKCTVQETKQIKMDLLEEGCGGMDWIELA